MAYRQSAATLNLLRAFAQGGYANLDNVHQWMLGFVKDSPQASATASWPTGSPRPWTSCGHRHLRRNHPQLRETDFYTSHEALLLGYEEALTRIDSTSGDWYATVGPHDLDRRPHPPDRPCPCRVLPRHQEPDRSEMRPVARSRRADDADRHPQPANEAGRLTLIARFGHDKVADHLPKLIRAVEREGRKVVWSCDPMHGNTITLNGYKTRPFERILSEVDSFFESTAPRAPIPAASMSR
jgi:3-deoxy-7-phosphoheptulonate synthase